jgi:hypothetical protein
VPSTAVFAAKSTINKPKVLKSRGFKNRKFNYPINCGDYRRKQLTLQTMAKTQINARAWVGLLIPEGIVVPRAWLTKKKLSRHAIDNLVKRGYLYVVSQGVYAKPPAELTWESLVCSLQTRFNSDLVVGGISALELHGFAHYLQMINQWQIHLYGTDPLPLWLNSVLDRVHFVGHKDTTLLGRTNNKHATKDLLRFTDMHHWRDNRASLIISSPERAILEVLADVPNFFSMEYADQLMQSMVSLSPEKLQKLLEMCENIKVRRLFFWLADRHNWPWLKEIDKSKIDLGAGKRLIEQGGKLDTKYNITVPKSL